MLVLHDYLDSGNGYKVRLLLHQLEIPFERIERDIDKGETRTPEFLAKNLNGRIPALELEDGTVLPESNAILFYLAEGTPFLPDGRLARAQTLQWMFFEQYNHEPSIAVARYIRLHLPEGHERYGELPRLAEKGQAALEVMEGHLEKQAFFAGGAYSIADIALYAYTHVAHDGGFDLAPYPAIAAWLERVAGQPRHIPITQG